MELLQLPQKCCMIRNGRENVRERIICFGCGPDSKRTIAGFHHFLPSPLLVPISSNTLHDCGLPLSSPKPSLTSGIRVEVFLGQEKNMKFPFAALVVLIHFPGSCPCCPRLQAGLKCISNEYFCPSPHPCQHLHWELSPVTQCVASFASWETKTGERCGVVIALGSLIQNNVFDNQPGRSSGCCS